MVWLLLLHLAGCMGWSKVLLTEAVSKGAVCLDGSPGGYYIRPGDPSKWVVFHEGGGWCSSTASCYERSLTDLGSSKNWKANYTDLYEGSHLFVTPPFSEWTVVFAKYCDGSSWTGLTSKPDVYDGHNVYYRGRLLLDALLDDLRSKGMGRASEILYAGCSAGALTSALHGDYVADLFPSARVKVLADAMFSLEHNSFAGVPLYPNRMKWGYAAWNASYSVNQACLHAHPTEGYKCMFGANLAPHIKSPYFALNSKYDSWQEEAIIGVNCSIADCPTKVQDFWVAYGKEMIAAATALPASHSVFLSNCVAHCQTGISNWDTMKIDGTAAKDAVVSWYQGKSQKWIEQCDVHPCSGDTC